MKDQFQDGSIVVENAIGFWIHRVYQASRNEMYRAFRAAGEDVTPEQWAVLIRLWERDGLAQSELSDATFRDPPTMSRIIDSMQRQGLIERRAHETDGRVKVIHLTRRGKALEKKLVPLVEKIVAGMVAGIDDRALATTRNALKKMFANLAS